MARTTAVMMVTVAAFMSVAFAATIDGQIDATVGPRIFDITSSEREWFRILLQEADYMLVGARDKVYNVSLDDLSKTSEITFTLDEEGRQNCQRLRPFFVTSGGNVTCTNYIRTAFTDGQNLVLCGSNGGLARCRELHYNMTTAAWSNTLSPPTLLVGAPPFAPPFPWMNFTMLRTREGLLFTGGSMIDLQRWMLHAVYRNGSADDSIKPMLTARRTELTVHALKTYIAGKTEDSRIYPNFIGTFETAEHVYWVFSEPALEAQPFQFVTTSRVARVCKNDMSHANVPTGDYIGALSTFVTYWKATLECSVPGKHADFGAYRYDRLGYNSFSFNTVAGSTPMNAGSVHPRSENERPGAIMYAVFNTDRNSIRGSAVCAYSYEEIQSPFSGPLYVLQAQDPLMASYRDNWWTWRVIDFESPHMLNKHHPAKCVNDSRLLDDNSIYPGQAMLANKVQPITRKPLFIQTDHRYLMTHIVVDWQLRALDGRYYDVLFIATDHGELLKMVNVGRNDTDVNFLIIENRTIVPGGQTPGEMRMIDARPGTRKRQLLVNTFETIRLVPLERCSVQTTCGGCVALRDPYCSWSPVEHSCVALYDGSQPKGHYQSVVDGVDSNCIPDPASLQPMKGSIDLVISRSGAEPAAAVTASSESQVSDHVRQSLSPAAANLSLAVVPHHTHPVVSSTTVPVPPQPDSPAVAPVRAHAEDGTAQHYSATTLAVACVITGVLCFGSAFLAGWCASRRCDAERCKVPSLVHLEHLSKDSDEAAGKLVDESRYATYPTKSNNLTPNKLNNTRTTTNEVYAADTITSKNTAKIEYV